ncbi:hypothetical protein ACJX0J_024509 [Zea mays]
MIDHSPLHIKSQHYSEVRASHLVYYVILLCLSFSLILFEFRCILNINDNYLDMAHILGWAENFSIQDNFLLLDISKAFDSISWPFLLDMLKHLGFGRIWAKNEHLQKIQTIDQLHTYLQTSSTYSRGGGGNSNAMTTNNTIMYI